jgi:hypothetical protein
MANSSPLESEKLHNELNSLARKIQKLNGDINSELTRIGYHRIEEANREMLFLPDKLRDYLESLEKSKEEFNSCIYWYC